MIKRAVLAAVFAVLFCSATAYGQGPCAKASGKLACVIPQEYGADQPFKFSQDGVFAFNTTRATSTIASRFPSAR